MRRLPVLLVALCALAGCASSSGKPAALPSSSTPSPSASPTPSPTPTATPRRTTHPPTQAPVRVPNRRPPVRHVQPHTAAPLLVTRLHGVGSADQVISVVAAGYGTSSATLEAFQRDSSGWHRAFGPWSAHIGRAGFAPPGGKREGDLRTPSGSYGFSFFFGVQPSPGVHYEWRRVTGSYDVWDDDSSSARYNLWTDTRSENAGRSPEPMQQVPAYNYSAVIAYNTSRTPGMGSAIFLHVSTGGGTAGCVSLPTSELLDVLRWLNPKDGPRIIMGTESTVT